MYIVGLAGRGSSGEGGPLVPFFLFCDSARFHDYSLSKNSLARAAMSLTLIRNGWYKAVVFLFFSSIVLLPRGRVRRGFPQRTEGEEVAHPRGC